MTTVTLSEAQAQYDAFKAQSLSLNMARGKPSKAQLDLSNQLLGLPSVDALIGEDGEDIRNYGNLEGLKEARRLMAELAGFDLEDCILYGPSTLSLAYDLNCQLLLRTPTDGLKAWVEDKDRSILCLTPGYDRHFAISEGLGFKLIPVDMTEEGPDLDKIEALVKEDAHIKGLWAVPAFSNPSGHCYTEAACMRLARMETAAKDFKIFWDLAYIAHAFEDAPKLPNILKLAEEAGHQNRIFAFCSTSKITFAGGGIAALFASQENLNWFKAQQKLRMICSDKVNQKRHAEFFKEKGSLKRHMQAHAKLLAPKFNAVLKVFDEHFKGRTDLSYTRPKGGYFICLTLKEGTATRVFHLAKDLGLTLTPAGATHPYGKDPKDSTLRLAPSFPSLEEIRLAAQGLVLCIDLAYAEQGKKA